MSDRPTRTKLRLGIVSSKPPLRNKGVTDEELDVLLTAESLTDRERKKPDTKETASRENSALPKKVEH